MTLLSLNAQAAESAAASGAAVRNGSASSIGQVPAAPTGSMMLPGSWKAVVIAIALGVGALGVLGFVNSFARVQVAAMPDFGWFAWTLPVGVDVGIAVFSALEIVLAKAGMQTLWVRLVAPALTAATVYLNVAGEPTLFGKVAHAVLPGLWIAAIAVAALVTRKRAKLERRAATRIDRIRLSRWVLAPWPTMCLYRRMVLWEIRSYSEALRREHDRVLALTDLKDKYGPIAWRWRAPRRTRSLYRLGELPLVEHLGEVDPVQEDDVLQLRCLKDEAVDGGSRKPTSKKTAKSAKTVARPTDVAALLPLARRVALDFERSVPGRRLTRDELVSRMRAAGAPMTSEKGSALIARLREDEKTAGGPTLDASAVRPATDQDGGEDGTVAEATAAEDGDEDDRLVLQLAQKTRSKARTTRSPSQGRPSRSRTTKSPG